MRTVFPSFVPVTLALVLTVSACGKKQTPVVNPTPAPTQPQAFPSAGDTGTKPPPPPPPVPDPPVISSDPSVSSDPLAGMTPDEINKQAVLAPVFFRYDSDSIDAEAQKILGTNADLLKKYSTWAITIEGHSDERGTAEYNLALGERRALAVKAYLITLGVAAERIRTVSYGKEFPFDPGHDEAAWEKNRRGHFVVTGK